MVHSHGFRDDCGKNEDENADRSRTVGEKMTLEEGLGEASTDTITALGGPSCKIDQSHFEIRTERQNQDQKGTHGAF